MSSAKARPFEGGVEVELLWKVEQTPNRNYAVAVSVLDEIGNVIGQHTGLPSNGGLPTKWWRPGDFVRDVHFVPVSLSPTQASQLSIGMYRPATGEHLAMRLPPCSSLPESRNTLDHLTLPLKSLGP